MAVHGQLYDAAALPTLVAATDADVVGVVTYTIEDHALEIVSCDADPPGQGVGRALVEATIDLARAQCLRRVWCTTTNDNLAALGFWQALGFVLVELRPGAVETDCLTGAFVAIAADVRTCRRATIVRCDSDHRHFGPRVGTPPSPARAGMPRCGRRCSRRP